MPRQPRTIAILSAAAFALLFSLIATTDSGAEEESSGTGAASTAASKSFDDYFAGKVVGIALKGADGERSSNWYTDVELVEIEGRKFLVGKYYLPDTKEFEAYSSYRGAIQGFAWEEVARFRALTEDQFKGYMKEWKERNEEEADGSVEKQ